MNMTEQKYLVRSNYFSNVNGLNGLATVPSNFVDLVLSDPPYGIADRAKLTKKGSKIVTTSQAWGGDFKDSWANIDDYYR